MSVGMDGRCGSTVVGCFSGRICGMCGRVCWMLGVNGCVGAKWCRLGSKVDLCCVVDWDVRD